MIIDRQKHRQFIADELKAQTDEFKVKLSSSAVDLLLEKNEVFVAIFVNFTKRGEMVLKLPASRPLPRKNDFLYCFTVPDTLRRYKDWGNMSYGELIKHETQATEVHCVWHTTSSDNRFVLAGFVGVSIPFKEYVSATPGGVVILGPKVPPYEYLANLETATKSSNEKCGQILDADYSSNSWNPRILSYNDDFVNIYMRDSVDDEIVILQGPPGTGKTHRIASLCKHLCGQGKSVLITALTNRALMEVADKLKDTLVKDGHVYKTNITSDEQHSSPGLINSDDVRALPGKLMLSTFYKTSKYITCCIEDDIFDYVIVDEASQAFLAMLAVANSLGRKKLWVGDVFQMPPIVLMSSDRVSRLGYETLVNGLDSILKTCKYKVYQLSDTFRLGNRAADFTGIFYNDTLISKSNINNGVIGYTEGPHIIDMDLPIGDPTPNDAINCAIEIVVKVLKENKSAKIAILCHLVKTVKALQVAMAKQNLMQDNVLIDTVARVQGITQDVVIYLIPDTDSKIYSLNLQLFNVATSRAKQNTFIICPRNIMEFSYMSPKVKKYMCRLFNDKDVP